MESQEPRVLVLVGDSAERSAVKACLVAEGYQVNARSSGMGLDRLVFEFPPDLLVADVRLPRGPDGLQVADRLRQEWGGIGIILLAASEATEECLAAFAAGSDDYLKRPFQMAELVARRSAERGTSSSTSKPGS